MDSDEIQGENKRELSKTHVGALILKLNAMAKKPHLDDDISGVSMNNCHTTQTKELTCFVQVLDKYLQKLNESEKYLSNGIFNTNFAEAALLLQSSVNVYGKKVDMLWDVVNEYQHRIVSYEEYVIQFFGELLCKTWLKCGKNCHVCSEWGFTNN